MQKIKFDRLNYTSHYLGSDIGSFQSWGVVDTITSYGDNLTGSLATFDNDKFLLWRGSGKNNFFVVQDDFVDVFVGHIFDHGTVNDGGLSVSFVNFFDWDVQSFGDVVDGFVFCKIEEKLKSGCIVYARHDEAEPPCDQGRHTDD